MLSDSVDIMASALPKTMKAACVNALGPLEKTLQIRTDVPLPKGATNLPANHLLVKVAYTSLNPFDYKIAESPLFGGLAFKGIPCLDFSGLVVDSTTTQFRQGDNVYGQTQPINFGACAEYVTVAAKYCMPMPDGLDLKDAATIGIAGLTAYQTIVPFAKAGDRIFINGGSGGVGTYGIQIAKAIGCSVTTSCSGANVDLCRSLGADEIIDYRTQNVVEELKRSGKQYDHVIDNVFSNTHLYWDCHHYLKPEGRFVTVAGSPSFAFIRDMFAITLWPTLLGGGQRKFQFVGRMPRLEDYDQIASWITDGAVKVVIGDVFLMEDVGKAFAKLKAGGAKGKMVVRVS